MKIATLGPEGTYSAQAASIYSPESELFFYGTISEVLKTVASGAVDAGVVPLENSIEGVVTESLDGIAASDLLITNELVIDVHHIIGGIASDIKPHEVQTIYSHPQALAQCAGYLAKKYPKAARARIDSTAAAIDSVAWSKERSQLAIGSEFAAKKYGLQIIDRNIEDEAGNQTRFVVVAKHPGRASLPFTLVAIKPETDRPGLLHDILGVIKDQGVNMLQIDSRPNRSKLGSHVFYIRLGIESQDQKCDEIAKLIRAKGVDVRKLSA